MKMNSNDTNPIRAPYDLTYSEWETPDH